MNRRNATAHRPARSAAAGHRSVRTRQRSPLRLLVALAVFAIALGAWVLCADRTTTGHPAVATAAAVSTDRHCVMFCTDAHPAPRNSAPATDSGAADAQYPMAAPAGAEPADYPFAASAQSAAAPVSFSSNSAGSSGWSIDFGSGSGGGSGGGGWQIHFA